MTTKKKVTKPTLVRVGNHLIDTTDVSCISKVKANEDRGTLYIVRLKSQPNMEFPIWVKGHEIGSLIKQFNIIELDAD